MIRYRRQSWTTAIPSSFLSSTLLGTTLLISGCGDDKTSEPEPEPEPVGACRLPCECIELTAEQCADLGLYRGDESVCPEDAQERGPNESGMLVVHYAADVTLTQAPNPPDLAGCADVVTSADLSDSGELVILYLLAAFTTEPEVAGTTFGIAYDTSEPVEWGTFGQFELATPNWPAPWEGIAVTFDPPQRQELFPVAWFALYAYGSTAFEVTDHPTHGITFADGSIPSVVDSLSLAATGFVSFGDTPGFNPCDDCP